MGATTGDSARCNDARLVWRFHMNRRSFVFATAAAGGAAIAGGAALLMQPAYFGPMKLAAMVAQLKSLRGQHLVSQGSWSAAHVFSHNAQSIDYSIAGFPESKGSVFQTLVGKPAFAVFSARGEMVHGLAEPIPGGYAIADDGPLDIAIDELLRSIAAFTAHSGPLQPHFANGALSKAEYEAAHVMHFVNHMSEITVHSS